MQDPERFNSQCRLSEEKEGTYPNSTRLSLSLIWGVLISFVSNIESWKWETVREEKKSFFPGNVNSHSDTNVFGDFPSWISSAIRIGRSKCKWELLHSEKWMRFGFGIEKSFRFRKFSGKRNDLSFPPNILSCMTFFRFWPKDIGYSFICECVWAVWAVVMADFYSPGCWNHWNFKVRK